MTSTPDTGAPGKRRNFLVLLPLLVFIGIAALFLFGLGEGDPSKLPSALIGKPVPVTNLPAIEELNQNG
ncbi:MAG: thiol:disulfide interchange protein, partial [Bradyrhizobium sp. 35-63-5]